MPETNDPNDVVFGVFDPTNDVQVSYRNLPHWFQPGVAIFLTFRTADSMPRAVIERWQKELEEWLCNQGLVASAGSNIRQLENLSFQQQQAFRKLRNRLWHRSLDNCHGVCLLRRPELAGIIGDALLHFNEKRYDLDSFVIMPNHVHVLFQLRPPTQLHKQTESWLRYSSRKINEQLGRKGPFWQSEPFDHLVRSPEQFEYLQKYIVQNPQKANLRPGEFLYWSRKRPPK